MNTLKKLLLLIITTVTLSSYSQEFVKNEVDEFTNKSIKITSWAKLNRTSKVRSNIRIRKINNTYILDYRFLTSSKSVFSVEKGSELMFKMSDESIIKLTNSKFQISSTGGGSIGVIGSAMPGMELSFVLDEDTMKKFQTLDIAKVRIYTTDGYIDCKVKKKHGNHLKELLDLYNQKS